MKASIYGLGLTLALTLWAWDAAASEGPLEVKTGSFYGSSVDRTLKYNIVLPEGYETSGKRYPTLYLLHGLTSHYQLWALMGVPEYAQRFGLIVVMPDVGNSWYVNWAESEGSQKNQWEDFMIKDLVGHIDATYRTIASRAGRAISGLSMGGYGAVMLGLRHPDMFCSVSSHSGALAYARDRGERMMSKKKPPRPRREPSDRPAKIIDTPGFNSQVERTPNGKPFVTIEDCDAYDPFKLVLEVPKEDLPHIHIDCGTEDRLIAVAQEFMKVLVDNTIPFSYAQSSGRHLPAYWTREVASSMAIQYSIIQRELAKSAKAHGD